VINCKAQYHQDLLWFTSSQNVFLYAKKPAAKRETKRLLWSFKKNLHFFPWNQNKKKGWQQLKIAVYVCSRAIFFHSPFYCSSPFPRHRQTARTKDEKGSI